MKPKRQSVAVQPAPKRSRAATWGVAAALVVAVVIVYFPALHFGFVTYDDATYLTGNPHVYTGLSWRNVAWAFTTSESSSWTPLTWLSHMLDFAVFGNRPGIHHGVNILLHAANALLLFLVLLKATKKLDAPASFWCCAVVAGLFALHPLHVESVAWISERKDVLSTFFGLLAIAAYVRYAEEPSLRRYLPILPLFALSLMAKSMLATLPVLLLLFDYWPLERLALTSGSIFKRVAEKVPLLFLSVAVSVLALYVNVQRGGSPFPLTLRLTNAIVAYGRYVWLTVWPARLSVIYPHAGTAIPAWQILAGSAFLGVACAATVMAARSRKYLIVGWLWFLISLFPVINIIQISNVAMADRYTYVPLIGLFIAVTWGLAERKPPRKLAIPVLAVVLVALSAQARHQVNCWRDSVTLFSHAAEATSHGGKSFNAEAHLGLADALAAEKHYQEAARHYQDVSLVKTRIDARVAAQALAHWAVMLFVQAQAADNSFDAESLYAEALEKYAAAFKMNPADDENLYNWGNALSAVGKRRAPADAGIYFAQAIEKYGAACELKPDNYMAQYNLANTLMRQAKSVEASLGASLNAQAIGHFQAALRIRPGLAQAWNNLGCVEMTLSRTKSGAERDKLCRQAEIHLLQAEKLDPGNATYNLACFYGLRGHASDCRKWLERASALGKLPPRQIVESDPDLDGVRDMDWFKAMMEKTAK